MLIDPNPKPLVPGQQIKVLQMQLVRERRIRWPRLGTRKLHRLLREPLAQAGTTRVAQRQDARADEPGASQDDR